MLASLVTDLETPKQLLSYHDVEQLGGAVDCHATAVVLVVFALQYISPIRPSYILCNRSALKPKDWAIGKLFSVSDVHLL